MSERRHFVTFFVPDQNRGAYVPEWTMMPWGDRRNVPKLRGTASCHRPSVIWFYERQGEHLRCEVRQMIEGDKFALVVTMPDGSERTELFEDSGALNRRSVELEQVLGTEGWNGPYGRII